MKRIINGIYKKYKLKYKKYKLKYKKYLTNTI